MPALTTRFALVCVLSSSTAATAQTSAPASAPPPAEEEPASATQPADVGADQVGETKKDAPSIFSGLRLGLFDPAPLDEPLVTDRPDFTESTDAVPRGRFQLESGYTFTYDRERKSRTREHVAPELLLRTGLFDGFELRTGWEGYALTSNLFETETRAGRRVLREDHEQGAADLSLGFKMELFEQEGLRPNFSTIAQLSVPTGSATTSSGDVDPEVKLLWSYDLTERLALSGNVNFAVPTEESRRFFQTAASVSLGVSLTERLGAYAEYYGFYPNARDGDCAHTLNGGLTFLVTDNFQLDCRVGTGLNEEADDFFAGVGFAIRW